MITEANIREYLLGRLDPNSKLVENIDEQILTVPEFSTTIDVVEDEIIEQYLEGSLNQGDTRAVERHFLRPLDRQRKLRSIRSSTGSLLRSKEAWLRKAHECHPEWRHACRLALTISLAR